MYDIAIIGAGAAGIACSKSAIENGLKVLLIEIGKSSFGGTCLNKGCIPTKFLLNSSKKQKTWKDSFIEKNEIVEKIKEPLFKFLESKGVDIILDKCSFLDNKTLDVGGKEVKAKNIIIATGSLPKTIINHPKIIFADDIFTNSVLPDKILIIGAGAIGIEFASMCNNFGKSVVMVEKEKLILPTFDSYFSKRLKMLLQKKGIKIETDKSASDLDLNDFDMIISAVGRIPNIENLKIENSGVSCDELGWIKTDKL
ncbi:MAG: NAD(P)/FAD-dependent oxidoreductase, partial [Candidatus Omnitrophica bacterium]|nr:NAD(P)/FAD-dependent oxidoreductase [Candidatus Omnitrophota bacterium]